MPLPTLNNAFPILDGDAPSFADIAVKAQLGAGLLSGPLIDIRDIAAISTATTVEIGDQRGASGGRVLRRTTGSVSYEASLTLYRSGYQNLIKALGLIAPLRNGQRVLSVVPFQIVVQHTPSWSTEIYEYRLEGVRLAGRTMNGAEGPDADQVEVPINVLQIVDVVLGVEHVML